jgi:hypothetical protein
MRVLYVSMFDLLVDLLRGKVALKSSMVSGVPSAMIHGVLTMHASFVDNWGELYIHLERQLILGSEEDKSG